MTTPLRQAVILAAGTGTRLMPLTEAMPKCMVEVGGRSIVERLLDAVAGLGVEEILFVTGHCEDALREHIGDERDGAAVRYLYNDRYRTTNNILSVEMAKDTIRAPFALLESDIVVRPEVIAPLSEPDTLIVAPYTEHMDGTGVVVGADGAVREMVIRAHQACADRLDGFHKTVNFYSFSEPVWERYRERLSAWVSAGRLDQYYEAVLAELVAEGLTLRAADVGLDGWAEVDDASDLERAAALFER